MNKVIGYARVSSKTSQQTDSGNETQRVVVNWYLKKLYLHAKQKKKRPELVKCLASLRKEIL